MSDTPHSFLAPGTGRRFKLPDVPAPFGAALLAALVLFICILWPVRVPIFFAMVAAITTRPLFLRVLRYVRGRRHAAAGLTTLLLLAAAVLPLLALIAAVTLEMRDAVSWATSQMQVDTDAPPSMRSGIDHLAQKLAQTLNVDMDAVKSAVDAATARWYDNASDLLTLPLDMVGNTLMLLIAHFFFAADGHHVANYLSRVMPLRPEQTSELLGEFHNVTNGAVLSSLCNGVGQGAIMFVGFTIAGVPHPILLGIVSCFAALVPLIGSMLVWIPAVVYLCVDGRPAWGAGLGVWCFVMVTVVDNTVKPWVLRGKVEFHGGLLLLGFVGGVGMFGISGLVAGPLVVAFLLTMLRIYQRDYLNAHVFVDASLHNAKSET